MGTGKDTIESSSTDMSPFCIHISVLRNYDMVIKVMKIGQMEVKCMDPQNHIPFYISLNVL